MPLPPLECGTFVRVRADHPEPWRAGRDGMVTTVFDDGSVGLVFYTGRDGTRQADVCVGPELWLREELDMSTVDRPNCN